MAKFDTVSSPSVGTMAKILSFVLLAVCGLQIATAYPLFGIDFGSLVEKVKDVAEDAGSKALEAAKKGISTIEERFESARDGIEDWLGLDDDDEENVSVIIKRDEKAVLDALEEVKESRNEAQVTLDLAAAVTSLSEAREAAKKALNVSLEATAKTELTVEKAIAVGLEIAQEATQKVKAVIQDAREVADEALVIAQEAIEKEIQLAAVLPDQQSEAADAALRISVDANQAFDEVLNKAESDADKLKEAADEEILEIEASVVEARNTVDEVFDIAADTVEQIQIAADNNIQLAVASGDVDTIANAEKEAEEAIREVDAHLTVLADAQENVTKILDAGLDTIKTAINTADAVIDDYTKAVEEAKQAAGVNIEAALQTDEAEEPTPVADTEAPVSINVDLAVADEAEEPAAVADTEAPVSINVDLAVADEAEEPAAVADTEAPVSINVDLAVADEAEEPAAVADTEAPVSINVDLGVDQEEDESSADKTAAANATVNINLDAATEDAISETPQITINFNVDDGTNQAVSTEAMSNIGQAIQQSLQTFLGGDSLILLNLTRTV